MKRGDWLQETGKMRFEEADISYRKRSLTQSGVAMLLELCDRTFRRYMNRYDEGGLDVLADKLLAQASPRQAPVDEVGRLVERYSNRHMGWNAKHIYVWYQKKVFAVTLGSRAGYKKPG